MLPYKELRGKEAFKKVKCFLGVPVEYKNEKLETLKAANVSKLSTINYISLKDLSKYLGSKN
jgi:large subunit ribosomal protein L13